MVATVVAIAAKDVVTCNQPVKCVRSLLFMLLTFLDYNSRLRNKTKTSFCEGFPGPLSPKRRNVRKEVGSGKAIKRCSRIIFLKTFKLIEDKKINVKTPTNKAQNNSATRTPLSDVVRRSSSAQAI